MAAFECESWNNGGHLRFCVSSCSDSGLKYLLDQDFVLLNLDLRGLTLNMQFDYLKSLEIEEKINKIRWWQTANGALFLLSTNDKTIKYWKEFLLSIVGVNPSLNWVKAAVRETRKVWKKLKCPVYNHSWIEDNVGSGQSSTCCVCLSPLVSPKAGGTKGSCSVRIHSLWCGGSCLLFTIFVLNSIKEGIIASSVRSCMRKWRNHNKSRSNQTSLPNGKLQNGSDNNSTIPYVLKGLVSLDKSFNEKSSGNILKEDNGLSRLKFVDNDANLKNESTMATTNRKKYEIVIDATSVL
ncbi:uncharacterized protein A4U43_C07F30240 [Asparagus officinalis]|uniref:Uncharacterized protein n=1 Tax=Asparagus officinalis TaxID=4686 RepID=A0A5P1EG49_ASPOF|nr:uncharacterized protein A4U43_C07F30240 [Asparagus officinalis]